METQTQQIDGTKYTEYDNAPAINQSNRKWSGEDGIPTRGTRVYVAMNGWKWGVVTGYFTEGGFIGVLVQIEVRPAWAIEQGKGIKPIHVFGAELASKEEYAKVAYLKTAKPKPAKATTSDLNWNRAVMASSVKDGITRVVLHRLNGQLCTHIENVQVGGFSHGRYFTREADTADAVMDFVERCEDYGVTPQI